MFTGIVEEVGKVEKIERRGRITRISVGAGKTLDGTKIGDSIAVDGTCLTVVEKRNNGLIFEAIPQTVSATTIRFLRAGSAVNLERALRAGDRIGGHFVAGHVDGIGLIRSRAAVRGNLEFRIGVEAKFLKFLIPRGSVAVDGVSLTVAEVGGGGFSVRIIPHTAAATTLAQKHAGGRVNVEFDMLLKRSP